MDRMGKFREIGAILRAVLFATQCASLAAVFLFISILPAGAEDRAVVFSRDKVIEVVLLSVADGKGDQLREDYYARALPIATGYGGQLLATFEVYDVILGDLHPSLMLFFAWPDMEARRRAESDPRLVKLARVRDGALRWSRRGFFSLAESVSVEFHRSKIYELVGMSMKPGHDPEMMQKFIQAVRPTAAAYGRNQLLELKPLPEDAGDYRPHVAGLVEWPSAEAFYAFTHLDMYQDGVRAYRDQAVARIEMINGSYTADFPGARPAKSPPF